MTGEQQIWLYYRPSGAESNTYEVLAITRPGTEVKYTLAALRRTLIFAIPATLILAGCLSFFLTRRALAPVESIARAAREIEERNLSQRIKVQSRDELGRLATTLNQMFDRLQRAFDRERQFTADASHELRTPLSIIESEATLALKKQREKQDYQRSLELIHQEASHMSSIIGKLLGLARADIGREYLKFDEVNLKELLTELASDIEVLCEEKSIGFHLSAQDALIVRGDKVKLRELFLNLLDNAIRYTIEGGDIFVSLTKHGSNAYVAVRDTGIGIPEEHLAHIFERFYRVDKTRSRSEGGSGLGLSICQRIVELHNGKIEVESKVGEGSTFTVVLPLWKKNWTAAMPISGGNLQ
jgi:heavy metal sensor kinase